MIKFLIVVFSCFNLVTGQCIGRCISNACPVGYGCFSGQCCSSPPTTTTTPSTCSDVASNCAANANLCSNSIYYDLMTRQCGQTCGRCSSTPSSTCVDKINPSTGTNDCPSMSYLCNNSAYYTLMTQQCPLTCGRCSG